MADISLTQTEADDLLRLPKKRIGNEIWYYPPLGGSIAIPLISVDRHEDFILDISRGKIDLSRGKNQNRARQIFILARLDFGGSPHRNPDEKEVPCPHLHIYREGYGDKWAIPIPKNDFPNIDNPIMILYDFMIFCNVIEVPSIQIGLFTS